jgi:hypothetical protein
MGWFKRKVDTALDGSKKNDIYSKGYLDAVEFLGNMKIPIDDRKAVVEDGFKTNKRLKASKKGKDTWAYKFNEGAVSGIMDVKKLMNENGMNLYGKKITDDAKFPKDLNPSYIREANLRRFYGR